ncbi:MAG: exo-alpha-sialidase [Bryobacteraceae bacterium]|nr:exo-alpha-sialidase [Bryobacteraceae bacterium]
MQRRDFVAGLPLMGTLAAQTPATGADWRNIRNGVPLPKEGYVDQPYIVMTRDGSWLCVLTTGKGVEGEPGQHIVSTVSRDKGKTWAPLNDIEPAHGPEASWVMPLITPSGRVYVFYTYNKENLRLVEGSNSPANAKRVDTLGHYAFKYSDDNGATWSSQRYYIPMRLMRIDRENLYGGKVLFFWGVGKPIIDRGKVWIGFAKVGKWGNPGSMVESQGCFLRSDNLLTERDPAKIKWELLPDGDEGLRAPKGPVSDEANPVALSDGSLYATYRTIDGYNCHAYSRDGGHTWTPPQYATYTPGGRRIKHSRAANFVKKFSSGRFLLWYHNHGGEAVHNARWDYYFNRNPAWVCGGVERNGFIHWSEPEILLYDDNPDTRMSYPDFVEDGERFFVTETQKTIARVHEIDRTLLDGLWAQHENRTLTRKGLVLEAKGPGEVDMPRLPTLADGGGFTLDLHLRLRELSPGQTVLDARDASGRGIAITTTDRFTLQLILNDGSTKAAWDSDPGTHPGTLRVGAWQHITVSVDSGPRIITWMVDGILNDGGAVRDFGWGRFPSGLRDVNANSKVRLAPVLYGQLASLRIYDRCLRTSEAVGNFRESS